MKKLKRVYIGWRIFMEVAKHWVITVGARIFIGFMTLSISILLLILFLIPKVNSVVNLSQEIQKENVPQLLDLSIYRSQDIVARWILLGDPEDKIYFTHIWAEINFLRTETDKALNLLGDKEILKKWAQIQPLFEPLYQSELEVINAPRTPDNLVNFNKSLFKIIPFKREMINILDGHYSIEQNKRVGGLYVLLMDKITKDIDVIHANLNSLKKFAYTLLIFTIFLTIIVPLMTRRSIAGPVDNAINIAERIATGERNVSIDIKSVDKLGKLLLSLKTMQEAIRENEEMLRKKEEESRELFDKLINSSKKFREHSSKVASGDLRERLDLGNDEILLELGKDLNLMTDGLASITKKITKVSNEIVTMVETVLESAHQQTEGITSQASAINQISASLEQIDKSSKHTILKANALREIAKSTYQQGKLGMESVMQSINGIKASEKKMNLIARTILDLSHHTQQIGDITLVLNTLAQQSKMLALNAAIEASKAGEAGKGFEAVATEVKNLAVQSEQSTIQVQKILEDISFTTEKAVTVTEEGTITLDSGVKLIEKTGQVIQTLSQMIDEASIASQQIETAIRQEAVGIEQIVENMNEINRTTSTFSSGIKEMMEFIHHLADIAKHLKEDVTIYKV